MISLKPKLPNDFTPEGFIQKVVKERSGNEFNEIAETWKSCAELYIQQGGNPEVVNHEKAIDKVKETILGLYSRTDPSNATVHQGVMIPLKKGGRQLQFCPLCGEAGTPYTLDHYLPKSKYPEFAILPHNLIPACDICQGKKLDNNLKDGKRCFLHPYFDSVEKQLIQLDIDRPFYAPREFSIVPHSKLTDKEKNLVQRHIDGLDINDRFKKFFASEHRKLIRLVTEEMPKIKNMTVEGFVKLFEETSAKEIIKEEGLSPLLTDKSNSLNTWHHIFYDGVLNNEGFMFYLESIANKQRREEVAQIDPEIVAKFKATAGNDWEAVINNVLKKWLEKDSTSS